MPNHALILIILGGLAFAGLAVYGIRQYLDSWWEVVIAWLIPLTVYGAIAVVVLKAISA